MHRTATTTLCQSILGIDSAVIETGSGGTQLDLDRKPRVVDLQSIPDNFGPMDLGAYELQSAFACGAGDTIFCNGFEPPDVAAKRIPMSSIKFSATRPLSAALAAALGLAIPAAGSSASSQPSTNTVMVVTSCADAGPGSLRDVVGMAPSETIIDVSQLPCAVAPSPLTGGAIPIGSRRVLTISGAAPVKGIVQSVGLTPTIDGGGTDRIFDHIIGTGEFDLTGVILRHGYAVGPGGCLRSSRSVVLFGSEVTGCTAHAVNYSCDGGGLSLSAARCTCWTAGSATMPARATHCRAPPAPTRTHCI